MLEKIREICAAFRVEGEVLSATQIKNGNINKTYRVEVAAPGGGVRKYIAQRVNTYVFKKPVEVMENIIRVTEHIAAARPGATALVFETNEKGESWYFEEDGSFWRLFNHVEHVTYNSGADMTVLREAGAAFGDFQAALSDFDASSLYYTIPDFHDTRKRYANFFESVRKDVAGRVCETRDEIAAFSAACEKACTLTDMLNAGELPLRVTHNDTKINNVLFDRETHRALVVIDLDTVMPGLVGHDFGDCVRFGANYVGEDDPDFAASGINMAAFEALADGFLSRTAKSLTQNEIDTLALSAYVITAEMGIRFLGDYLDNDVYFKCDTPDHNLRRARTQVALLADIERHLDEMQAIVREKAEKYRAL